MLVHQVEPQLETFCVGTRLQGSQIRDKVLENQPGSVLLKQTERDPVHIVQLFIVEVVCACDSLLLLEDGLASQCLQMLRLVLFAKFSVQAVIVLLDEG